MEAVTLNPNMVIIGDLAYETTIIENKRHETSISFAYHSLQSESMARATPANMPH